MKLNKIIAFFLISVVSSIFLRFYMLNYTIETHTGFFILNFDNYGKLLLLLIFIFCFATTIFAFFTFSKPEKPPKENFALSLISVISAIVICIETYYSSSQTTIIPWQSLSLKIAGFGTGIYLIFYGISALTKIKPHPVFSTIFPIYFIIRLVCDFSLISKLTLISDYMLLLAAFCYLLLFTLSFSKLYNNSNPERNFKFLLATGLGSASLCFTIAIPHIVFNLLNGFNYLHTSIFSNITLLFLGIFIIVFLISYFSRKNHSN